MIEIEQVSFTYDNCNKVELLYGDINVRIPKGTDRSSVRRIR